MSAPPSSPRWFFRVLIAYAQLELSAMGGQRLAFLIRILGFAVSVGTLLFLSRFVGAVVNPHLTLYRSDYFGFVVIGLLGTQFQQVGVSVLAQRIRFAQLTGTMEAELTTPAPPWMVLGAPAVYEFIVAALRSAAYLVGASILLGLELPHVNWLSVAIAVPLIVTAFSGLGLLAGATTMLVRRSNPVAQALGSLSFFLSGVVYPVTVLPGWLRAIGQLLPLTHVLLVMRGALLVGSGPVELRQSLIALLIFAGLLALIGVWTFSFALRRARMDGSLSHY